MKNKISLRRLLNGIFSNEIKRITYLGNCNIRKMPEYKFNLLKFNVALQDYSNYSAFIRIIDKCQIEESLFCYWLFCEEYFSINTRFYAPKASITSMKNEEYEKRYKLQLLNNKNEVYKSSLIDIVDIEEYCKNKLLSLNSKNNNKYLFVAII